MKAVTFGVLALCLVLTQAATRVVNPIEDGISSLGDYADTANKKADTLNKEIENMYDEKILQPLERIDASVNEIEGRKKESKECVERQEKELDSVVENAIKAFDACAETATKSSTVLALQITKVSLEIGYDTYKLVQDYQKCKDYKSTFWKTLCYTKASAKTAQLTIKTKNAIEDLATTKHETVPQLVGELDSCSVVAEHTALAQLEEINHNIDHCIAALI